MFDKLVGLCFKVSRSKNRVLFEAIPTRDVRSAFLRVPHAVVVMKTLTLRKSRQPRRGGFSEKMQNVHDSENVLPPSIRFSVKDFPFFHCNPNSCQVFFAVRIRVFQTSLFVKPYYKSPCQSLLFYLSVPAVWVSGLLVGRHLHHNYNKRSRERRFGEPSWTPLRQGTCRDSSITPANPLSPCTW